MKGITDIDVVAKLALEPNVFYNDTNFASVLVKSDSWAVLSKTIIIVDNFIDNVATYFILESIYSPDL